MGISSRAMPCCEFLQNSARTSGAIMDRFVEYKEKIIELDQFVRQLDESVRGEAFKFLLNTVSDIGDNELLRNRSREASGIGDTEMKVLERLGKDADIPIDRVGEVFAVKDSVVEVVDCSIPNNGPADLVKKITLLSTYANTVGRGAARFDVLLIYKNVKNLNAATTSYSRDVKKTDGVKVLSDGTAILTPEGRGRAKLLLNQILRLDEAG